MLAKTAPAGPTPPSAAAPQWVVFRCDGHRFAVPLSHVREIVLPREVVRIPGCPAAVAGLVNLRGRMITVFDFGAAVSLGSSSTLPDHRLLILDQEERLAGLAVDEVLAVARTPGGMLAVPAKALEPVRVDRADVLGLGEWDGEPFLAMDPGAMLRRLRS